jgi:putative protease
MLKEEISQCTYRQFSTGFYFGKPDENSQIYESNTYVSESVYLGIVAEVRDGLAKIYQKNKFCTGDVIEIMKTDGRDISVKVLHMYDADKHPVDACPHPGQEIWLELEELPEEGDILRIRSNLKKA